MSEHSARASGVPLGFHELPRIVALLDPAQRVDGRIKFHTYAVRE